ncbi:unnamed protein product [Caenorhabditis angaria]|uniref:Uncharacterized protein n=1 Tax=Caenorhabditis angaria TaxID=860376 RepID=A0A9P1IVE3_9PELO|nr:unnamed protein product [Caenorhabditis angaria]
MDSLISRIVATPDVFYKHLKFDEDELTNDEKVSILRNLIENNISLFLTRYGKYLSSDDCSLFNSSDDPFVEFLLKSLKDSRPRNTKNERYILK